MIRPLEPTIITTSSGEEVFVLTLSKGEWEMMQKKLELKKPESKKPAPKESKRKKRTLPTPVKLEGTQTASDYVQTARD